MYFPHPFIMWLLLLFFLILQILNSKSHPRLFISCYNLYLCKFKKVVRKVKGRLDECRKWNILCMISIKPSFSLFFISALDSRPKSSSPVRLPEVSSGQTNRSTEADLQPPPSKMMTGEVITVTFVPNHVWEIKTHQEICCL